MAESPAGVSSRAFLEAARRMQAEHLALIFDNARDMLLLGQVEPGVLFRVIAVNRPYVEAIRATGFDLSAEDFAGRTLDEVLRLFRLPEKENTEIHGRYSEVIRTGRRMDYMEVTPTPAGAFYGRTSITAIPDETGRCAFVLYASQDATGRVRAEEARRDSEAKFVAAFRVSPDLISITDYETGRYLEVNGAHEAFFGHSREEMVGRTPLELGIVREQDSRRETLRRLAQEGHVRDYRVDARTRDGRPVIISVNAEVLEIDGRKCILRVSRDVTAAVQAERSLRESEEKFTKAFKSSPDAISVHELESGRYVEVNDGFLRLFGWPREQVVGRTPLELGIWADGGDRQNFVQRLRQEGSVRNHPVQVRSREGRISLCELSAEVFDIGGVPHNVTVLRDVTEQRSAEQALRESEAKFARAFRSSPYPLIISELATGRIIDVNDGFETFSGHPRDVVIGRTSLELGIWRNAEDRAELVGRLQREGKVRDLEIRYVTRDGSVRSARCSCEQIELSGRACLLAVLEDVTDRQRTEREKAELEEQMRQAQKLEALGTLAGGIAHDFNNILTAVIVNQELALMDLHEPEALRRRLDEIGQASARAKELVRQILTFSRQQPHEKLRQHLQMIVREALGLLRASLPASIEISQELAPDTPAVLADASQIHQVMMNLCTNAAHAMRERGGRLTVRLAARTLDEAACRALPGLRPGRYARLTVGDTGQGMDATVLARIFEPFFTTKGPGEGTGLGLPMVHGIVRDHGGGIFVESMPGVGTTFDLYFPEAAEAASRAPVSDDGIVPGRGECVLVVDDEPAICRAVGAMLKRIGYRVETCEDPREALERFRANPAGYDMLLTDRTMPHLSGPKLVAQAREWWTGLPAIVMSGLSGPEAQEQAAGKPDYGIVAKPIDIADLSRAVRQALGSRPRRPS